MQVGSGRYSYELVDGWANLPEGETFLDVTKACIDADDNVLVFNRSDHPVMVFDPSGERVATWGEGLFSDRPHGMCLDPEGAVYCTDDMHHTVTKFTPDGERVQTLGTKGEPSETGYRDGPAFFENLASITEGGGPFNRPTGVTVSDSGEVFVADGYGNAMVHVFSREGELLRSWGGPGADPGQFRLPHSIHTDGDDRIWVTDRENSRIQIFDTDGEFIAEWTDPIRPTDLAIVDDEVVFVAELCKRISVFTIDGEPLARWENDEYSTEGEETFVAPHTVAVDSSGDVYVGDVSYTYASIDRGARTIQKFTRAT